MKAFGGHVPGGSLMQALTRDGYLVLDRTDQGLSISLTQYKSGRAVSASMVLPMADERIDDLVAHIRGAVIWA